MEANCTCASLLLSSLGAAGREHPGLMGVWRGWEGKEWSRRPVYRGPSHTQGELEDY